MLPRLTSLASSSRLGRIVGSRRDATRRDETRRTRATGPRARGRASRHPHSRRSFVAELLKSRAAGISSAGHSFLRARGLPPLCPYVRPATRGQLHSRRGERLTRCRATTRRNAIRVSFSARPCLHLFLLFFLRLLFSCSGAFSQRSIYRTAIVVSIATSGGQRVAGAPPPRLIIPRE